MPTDPLRSDIKRGMSTISTNTRSKLETWMGASASNWHHHSDTDRWRLKYGGVLIATIGFVLTRVTVLPAIHLDVPLLPFLAGDILPLVFGLGITIVGLSLSISTFSRSYVNTIATWCLLGTFGMAVVVGVIVFQVSLYNGAPSFQGVWTSSILGNTLIAGAIGGILIGNRSATNQQHRRDLAQQATQATILNRLLRHEVLNKLTVIRGYATQLIEEETQTAGQALQQIQQSSDQVQEAIDEIGFLTRVRPRTASSFDAIHIAQVIHERMDAIREKYPEAEVTVDGTLSEPVQVRADSHFGMVFTQLLENAIVHSDASTPQVTVSMDAHETYVQVSITDDGPGLSQDQQAILENGVVPSYDDPSTGFGVPLVRMLVSQYRGTIDVDTTPTSATGTNITLTFQRARDTDRDQASVGVTGSVGVNPRHVGSAAAAALVAGIVMGFVLYTLTDALPAIGGLYGVQSLGVGWTLHLFHSIVFGLVFAAVLTRPRFARYATSLRRHSILGLGYGLVLWAGAAGVVMPVWLNLVGIPAPIPFLTLPSLLGHAIWGLLLGAMYSHLTP